MSYKCSSSRLLSSRLIVLLLRHVCRKNGYEELDPGSVLKDVASVLLYYQFFFAILCRYFFVQLRSHENEKKMRASVNQMLVTFGEKTLKKIMPRKIWGEKKVWSKYFKWSKLGLDEEKGSNFFLSKFSKVWLDLFIKFTLTRSFSLSSGLKTPSSGFKILPNVSILYEPRYHSLSSFFPPHYNGEKKGKKSTNKKII